MKALGPRSVGDLVVAVLADDGAALATGVAGAIGNVVFMIVPFLLQRSVSSVHTQMALRIKYSGLRAADQELRG